MTVKTMPDIELFQELTWLEDMIARSLKRGGVLTAPKILKQLRDEIIRRALNRS